MSKKFLIVVVCLTAVVTQVFGQSRSKQVKQPREVIEAYQVCEEFQRLLAEDFDFDRAFEATFVKDLARRRAIAIAGSGVDVDLAQVDTGTIVDIYKQQTQLFILMMPLLFVPGVEEAEEEVELLPPPIATILARKPANDPQQLAAYLVQRKRDVADFRAHVEKIASSNSDVAKNRAEYKKHLSTPLERPTRTVKPLTAYSRGKVLRVDEKYYQINDCAVIREGAQMKLVGYVFLKFRW